MNIQGISWIVGIIVIATIILIWLQRVYYKKLDKINVYSILFIGYAVLIANMLLSPKFYSVEWAFLAFFLIAVIFYDFRIDSRFLILPAIVLLGYVPFLLIGLQNPIAEIVAIYVYYFLVVGVILQIVESIKNPTPRLDFEIVMKKLLDKVGWVNLLIFFGLVSIAVIILNRFYSLEFWKWTVVYVFAVIGVFYLISSLRKSGKLE